MGTAISAAAGMRQEENGSGNQISEASREEGRFLICHFVKVRPRSNSFLMVLLYNNMKNVVVVVVGTLRLMQKTNHDHIVYFNCRPPTQNLNIHFIQREKMVLPMQYTHIFRLNNP